MTLLVQYLNYALDLLYRATRVFGTVMLAGVIGLTCYDVFMRYTFNKPILGSNEMIQFLLGCMIFAGFALVTAHRSHIVVSLFEPFLLRHVPGLYKGLVNGFNLLGIIAIAFIVIRYTDFEYRMFAETEILELRFGDLGWVFTILAAIGIAFGIKALKRPRRKGNYVPYREAVIAQITPFAIELEAGRKYAWCACGRSATQPFCDGTHKGADMKPVVFVAENGGLASLCGCKQSDNAPYCNGRHNDL